MPLTFARTYNSDLNTYSGPLGFGWTHNYNMRIERDAGNNYLVHEENGSVTTFTPSFGHDARVLATLSYNSSTAEYLFTRIHGQIKYYLKDVGSGASRATKLVRIIDRNGLTTSLSYDGKARLTTVTEPNQRRLTFGYSGNNNPLISTVTDNSGRVVRFEYLDGAGNLTKVTDVGNEITLYAYDPSHRLDTITEKRNGANHPVLDNDYDGSNRVIKQSYLMGRYLQLGYVGASTRMTNTLGLITVHQYSNNKITKVIDQPGATAQQAVWDYSYEPGSTWIATTTDPNRNLSSYTWDANGNLLTATDPLYRTTKYAYNSTNDLTVITPTNTYTTSMAYDGNGNLLSVTRLLTEIGQPVQTVRTRYEYDPTPGRLGDLLTVTNPLNRSWAYTYDTYGYPRSASDPLGHTSYTYYDNVGRMYGSLDARGNPTNYSNNAYGQLVSVANALSYTTVYTYDAVGNLIYTRDPKGHVITNTYNLNNELTKVTQPDGTYTEATYDGLGRVKTQSNALRKTTTYEYDDLNRQWHVQDPLLRVTQYRYDRAGRLTGIQVPGGGIINYDYYKDDSLRGINYNDPATPNVSLTYNSAGLRETMSDGSGISRYNYDSLDRITSTSRDVDGENVGYHVDYKYDLAGNLAQITYPAQGDGVRRVILRTFDPANRMDTLRGTDIPTGNIRLLATFGYDHNGNLTSIDTPSDVGFARSFRYDAANQVISDTYTLGDPAFESAEISYTRDPLGFVENSYEVDGAIPTGTGRVYTHTYEYDNLNRLTRDDNPFDEIDRQGWITSTWSMDPANQVTRTSVIQLNGPPSSIEYDYDDANQLTDMTTTTGTAAGNVPAAERQSGRAAPLFGSAGVFSGRNLPKVAEPVVSGPNSTVEISSFGYSDTGNRILKSSQIAGAQSADTIYRYDRANRLTYYSSPDGNGGTFTGQYKYDGDGLRLEKQIGSSDVITYTWDIAQGLPLILQDQGPDADRNFIYGPGNILIGQLSYAYFAAKPQGAPDTPTPKPEKSTAPEQSETELYHYFYYFTDQAGSVRQMLSHNLVVTEYTYDAYGKRTCPDYSHCLDHTPFGFTGQYQDDESGLLYMRARYYDPATQQFISRDPQEATTGQPYVYANRNPVNFVDPDGALPHLVFADIGPEEQDWGKGPGGKSGAAGTPGGGGALAARARAIMDEENVPHTVAVGEGSSMRAHSGWSKFYVDKGFVDVEFSTIRNWAKKFMNFTFKPDPKYPERDQGVTGRYVGTHAEVKIAYLMVTGKIPRGRIGISNPLGPCDFSCQPFFQALASKTGRVWHIEDPTGRVNTFRP